METLKHLREGYWRRTSNRSPVEQDIVLGMFNEWKSIWLFRCVPDKGYVPVCASSTTQPGPIYVSDFSWLPRFNEPDWRTSPDLPDDAEPVVGIRRGSTDPEMLTYWRGKFWATDIEDGIDEYSEVVDCIKWIDLPEPPAPRPRTKKAKREALRRVN
jgi:hypothetical protein